MIKTNQTQSPNYVNMHKPVNNSNPSQAFKKRHRNKQHHQQQYETHRKEQEEQSHYFYDYLMAIHKKFQFQSIIPDNLYGNIFVNMNRFTNNNDHETFSDVTIIIHYMDGNTNTNSCVELFLHRIILTRSDYFVRLFKEKDLTTGQEKRRFDIYLDVVIYDIDVVKEFFRLFYVSIFDDTQLHISKFEMVVSNSILLHSLSSQFLFTPLRKYCKKIIFERFDLELFINVFKYCTASLPHYNNNNTDIVTTTTKILYYIIPDKIGIFKRLISWFICCADIHQSQLPYINLSTTVNYEEINRLTNTFNDKLYKSTEIEENIMKRKKKRLITSNDNKIETFDYISSSIYEFEKYDLYSCYIKEEYINNNTLTSIRSFSRVCKSCIETSQTVQICRMNQVIPYSNTIRKWNFYLELTTEQKKNSTLYAKVIDLPKSNSRHDMHIENHTNNSLFSCHTTITMLSKLYKNKPTKHTIVSNLNTFTPLQQFYLHEHESCYNGECDVCHIHNTRIFIIKYDVDVSLF